jgi:hypothetical protein
LCEFLCYTKARFIFKLLWTLNFELWTLNVFIYSTLCFLASWASVSSDSPFVAPFIDEDRRRRDISAAHALPVVVLNLSCVDVKNSFRSMLWPASVVYDVQRACPNVIFLWTSPLTQVASYCVGFLTACGTVQKPTMFFSIKAYDKRIKSELGIRRAQSIRLIRLPWPNFGSPMSIPEKWKLGTVQRKISRVQVENNSSVHIKCMLNTQKMIIELNPGRIKPHLGTEFVHIDIQKSFHYTHRPQIHITVHRFK